MLYTKIFLSPDTFTIVIFLQATAQCAFMENASIAVKTKLFVQTKKEILKEQLYFIWTNHFKFISLHGDVLIIVKKWNGKQTMTFVSK